MTAHRASAFFLRLVPAWAILLLVLTGCPPDPTPEPTPTVHEVTISPETHTLEAGETHTFAADVAGDNLVDTSVSWSLEGDATGDAISSAGVFTAGAAADDDRAVTVVATSNADTSIRGTATVTVRAAEVVPDPVVTSVTVTPGTANVAPGTTEAFSAGVAGQHLTDTSVTWSLRDAADDDAISTAGVFTAGDADAADRVITIVATSNQDDTVEGTATATVPGNPPVVGTVTVSPATATVDAGESQAFEATVTGQHLDDTTVTWTLQNGAEDDAITAEGLFTAGVADLVDRVITVVATSNQDDATTGEATVTVPGFVPPPVVESVTLVAPTSTLASGESTTLTAVVAGTHLTDTTVTWSLDNAGPGDVIDSDGLFTAGLTSSGERQVTIVATSNQDDAFSDAVTLTITPLDAFDASAVFVDAASPLDDLLGQPGSQANPFATIPEGLTAVEAGGTVYVAAGDYPITTTLGGFKTGVSLIGAGPQAVTIDASAAASYGLLVTVDGVTLSGFTLHDADTYGIKTSPAGAKIDGLTISQVEVRGSGITEIDLNNVSNAHLVDVIADGEGTAGVGVALVSVDGVVLERVSTLGNTWGGVGIFSGAYIGGVPDAGQDITIDASNDVSEGIYLDDAFEAGLLDFGDRELAIAGITYAATNGGFRADAANFVFLLPDADAVSTLVGLLDAAGPLTVARSVVTDQAGHLQPTDDLLVVEGMSLQHSVNAAVAGSTIAVDPGTYVLANTLNGFPAGAALIGAGRDVVTIDASAATTYGLDVAVDGVVLSGFTLFGAGTYGIKTGPKTTDAGLAKLDGLTIDGVTVRGCGRTEIDVNSVTNGLLVDVLADGEGTTGVGVALINVEGVVFEEVTTRNNNWGGVGVYSGDYIDGPDAPRDVSIDATNLFEDGIYIDDQYHAGLLDFGDNQLAIPWITWMVTSASHRDGGDGRGEDFVLFARDDAERDAILATLPSDAIVRTVITNDQGYIEPGTDWVVLAGRAVQPVIDAAPAGATVRLSAGDFDGPLTLDKALTLQGAGATDTRIAVGANAYGVLVTGTSTTERATLSSLGVVGGEGNTSDGIQMGSHTTLTDVSVTEVRIGLHFRASATDVHIDGTTSAHNDAGLRVATTADVSDLTITGSHFDDNLLHGMVVFAASGESPPMLDDVLIQHTTFSRNGQKGIYVEKLSNALLEDVVIEDSGVDPDYGFNAGIDVNLKYGDYAGVTLRRVDVIGSGALGTATNPHFPVAVTLKARDDAPSYSAPAASLTDVTIEDCEIDGLVNGLGFGEPGKLALSPTQVVIVDSALAGGTGFAALNHTTVDVDATQGNTFDGVPGADVTDEVYDEADDAALGAILLVP